MGSNILSRFHDRGRKASKIPRRNDPNLSITYSDDLAERIDELERNTLRFEACINKKLDALSLSIERVENLLSQAITKMDKLEERFPVNDTNVQSVVIRDDPRPRQSSAARRSRNNEQPSAIMRSLVRISNLIKRRKPIEKVKAMNIYKNEPCFDTEIENVLKHAVYLNVPKIIVDCVELIEEKMKIKVIMGLYRMSGEYTYIQHIRFCIDADNYDSLKWAKDVHVLTGVLKLFLREIKSPLIKGCIVKSIISSSNKSDYSSYKIEDFRKLIKILPEINRDSTCYLIRHFNWLTSIGISSESLAISVSPSLFQETPDHRNNFEAHLYNNTILKNCLKFMIEHYEDIFKNSD